MDAQIKFNLIKDDNLKAKEVNLLKSQLEKLSLFVKNIKKKEITEEKAINHLQELLDNICEKVEDIEKTALASLRGSTLNEDRIKKDIEYLKRYKLDLKEHYKIFPQNSNIAFYLKQTIYRVDWAIKISNNILKEKFKNFLKKYKLLERDEKELKTDEIKMRIYDAQLRDTHKEINKVLKQFIEIIWDLENQLLIFLRDGDRNVFYYVTDKAEKYLIKLKNKFENVKGINKNLHEDIERVIRIGVYTIKVAKQIAYRIR